VTVEQIDFYLHDKFVEFSAKIKALNDQKNQLRIAFRKQYDKYTQDMKTLEDKGKEFIAEFEAWKKDGDTAENPVPLPPPADPKVAENVGKTDKFVVGNPGDNARGTGDKPEGA
jgi:hypothetical protein